MYEIITVSLALGSWLGVGIGIVGFGYGLYSMGKAHGIKKAMWK